MVRSRGRSAVGTTSGLPIVLLSVILAVGAGRATAQDQNPTSLRGTVLDLMSESPLAGARVQIEGLRGGTLTDSMGVFVLEQVPLGAQLLLVEHYGFESMGVALSITATQEPVIVHLPPKPVMLDGLSVVTDRLAEMESRLRRRRRAVATSARAFELERLMRTGARDMLDFLRLESNLPLSPCGGRSISSLCVFRRGRWVQPRVYIDEVPALGGLDQLGSYRPHELYLVEVYSSGMQIRAYTHLFMERMARRPVALIPIMD